MFFKLADTHANRHFLQNKRHRHVNDLFPGILIAWLDSNDQQAAELEGIELKRSSSPNDKLFAIEAKASNRVFLNELLGRQIAHDTESNEFHVCLNEEELRLLQVAGIECKPLVAKVTVNLLEFSRTAWARATLSCGRHR